MFKDEKNKTQLEQVVAILETHLPVNEQINVNLIEVAQKMLSEGETVQELLKNPEDTIEKAQTVIQKNLPEITVAPPVFEETKQENLFHLLHKNEEELQQAQLNYPQMIAEKILEQPSLSQQLDNFQLSQGQWQTVKNILEDKVPETVIQQIEQKLEQTAIPKPEYTEDIQPEQEYKGSRFSM